MDDAGPLNFIQDNYAWVYPILGFFAARVATRLRGAKERRLTDARENLKGLVELAASGVINLSDSRRDQARRHVEKLAGELYDKGPVPPRWYTNLVSILAFLVTPVPVLMSSFLDPSQLAEAGPQTALVVWLIAMVVTLLMAVIWLAWSFYDDYKSWREKRKKAREARKAGEPSKEPAPTEQDNR